MSVSLVATVVANNGQTANTTTAQFTIPNTIAAGDTAFFVSDQNSGVATYTPPGGWTQVAAPNANGTINETVVYGRDLVLADANTTITFTSSVTARFPAVLVIFRGTSLASAFTTLATSSTSTTTLTSPSITTTVANTWIVNFWAIRAGTTSAGPTVTVPANHTADAYSGTAFSTTPNYAVQVSHLTTPGAAGTYGGQTATASATTTAQSVYSLALPPAASAFSGSLALSGSGSMSGAGTPGLLASEGFTGGSGLSLAGTPAITGALGVGGGSTLTLTGGAPFAASLALGSSGSLALSGAAFRQVCRGVLAQRYVPLSPPLVALMNYSKAILRINGEWIEAEFPAEQQIDAADIYLPGGYETFVDAATAAILTAAGYTVELIALE